MTRKGERSLTFGSLFSGIGGFDLGFERAGMKCLWQCEIDKKASEVLAKHWPDVRRYEDVRTIGKHNLEPVDVICGGFPCQPHSLAGKRLASADERDLWGEFSRIIRELNPRWAVAENVPGLFSSDNRRFFGTILRDLASCGYDAEWQVVPASAFGAPHIRERIIILAYPDCARFPKSTREQFSGVLAEEETFQGCSVGRRSTETEQRNWWSIEPNVGRVANGVPGRVDRLKQLGNAIVPQVAEWIGRRINA